MSIDEESIRMLIRDAKNAISEIDTGKFTKGKIHRYLSKAFVAGIGRFFKSKYSKNDFSTRFQDFKDGKGVKGEWLFDVVVVKMKSWQDDKSQLFYPDEVEIAIESELDPGKKAFFDDFTKLLIVNAKHKVYFHGIKNIKDKKKFISDRMKLIEEVISNNKLTGDFTICFVDHPSFWNNEEVFVQVLNANK